VWGLTKWAKMVATWHTHPHETQKHSGRDRKNAAHKTRRVPSIVFTGTFELVPVSHTVTRAGEVQVLHDLERQPFMDEWCRREYSVALAAMDEAPLLSFGSEATVYRVLEMPAFVAPMAARLVLQGDNSFVVWKRLPREINVEEEGDPGVLAYQERRHKLTGPETKGLAELLEKARFWERATTSVFDTGEEDGTIWMLEGCTGGEHHVVHWGSLWCTQ